MPPKYDNGYIAQFKDKKEYEEHSFKSKLGFKLVIGGFILQFIAALQPLIEKIVH